MVDKLVTSITFYLIEIKKNQRYHLEAHIMENLVYKLQSNSTKRLKVRAKTKPHFYKRILPLRVFVQLRTAVQSPNKSYINHLIFNYK
jgi:hypothetical protein